MRCWDLVYAPAAVSVKRIIPHLWYYLCVLSAPSCFYFVCYQYSHQYWGKTWPVHPPPASPSSSCSISMVFPLQITWNLRTFFLALVEAWKAQLVTRVCKWLLCWHGNSLTELPELKSVKNTRVIHLISTAFKSGHKFKNSFLLKKNPFLSITKIQKHKATTA